MKLIEIKKDEHYIIVDDSKIKRGDWYYSFIHRNIFQSTNDEQYFEEEFKITHSVQPIEEKWILNERVKFFDKIKPLSLSEIKEVIYGYSVEKMAYNWFPKANKHEIHFNLGWVRIFEEGFNSHKELTKDKLFTIEQLKLAWELGAAWGDVLLDEANKAQNEFIESLSPKTEWEVEFDENGKLKLK